MRVQVTEGHVDIGVQEVLIATNRFSKWRGIRFANRVFLFVVSIACGIAAGCGGSSPKPTVSVSLSPSTLTLGASSTLTWSSTHATSCTASGAWSGSQATSGTQSVTPAAAGTDTYTLTCKGSGGSASGSATLTVNAPPAPAVTISVSPATITTGSSSTLIWSSTNATACTASGAWSGSEATSGTQTVTPAMVGTDTYTLACTGAGGSGSASATLTVNAPPVPTVTISVSPSSITVGSSSTLTWSSTNASACTASGAWSGSEATSGTETVTPKAVGSDKFTLSCTGTGGNGSNSAVLTVNAPPASAYIYVLNSQIFGNPATITGYSESSSDGTLALLPDSPYNSTLLDSDSIAVDSQLNLLFVAGGSSGVQSTGEIDAFSIDPTTGSLNAAAPVVTTPVDAPTEIAIGPSGNFLFVSSHSGDSVAVYSIAASGSLSPVSGSPFTIPGSNCGLFCEPTADQLAYDPVAQTLYVTSTYGFIATFTVDPSTGVLTFISNLEPDGPDGLPATVAANPAGTFLYAAGVSNVGGTGFLSAYSVTTDASSGGNLSRSRRWPASLSQWETLPLHL
jgi:hypothetical protein